MIAPRGSIYSYTMDPYGNLGVGGMHDEGIEDTNSQSVNHETTSEYEKRYAFIFICS